MNTITTRLLLSAWLLSCADLPATHAWIGTAGRQRHGEQTTHLHASTQQAPLSRSVTSLVDWGESVGIQKSPALKLNKDDTSGYGWKTTQEGAAANAVLLQVPSDVALTVSSPGDGPDDSRVVRQAKDRRAFRNLPWYCQFSAYLHVIKQSGGIKNDSLNLQSWLASLPTQMDTPIHWDDEQVSDLQYDFMSKAVEKQKKAWRGYHASLQQNGFADLSWDDFVWGCEMARSRAFSGAYTGSAFNPGIYAFTLLLVTAYIGLGLGSLDQAANGAGVVFCYSVLKDFVLPKLFKNKKFVICPLIDMANHQSVGHAGDVSFEYFGNAYSLATNQAVPKDTPVCISYGARSNDQWLQYYGFCESKSNPHDVYILPPLREWPIADMEEAAGRSVAAGRLQALDRAGLLGYTSNIDQESEKQAFDENAANADGGVVVTRAVGLDPAVWQALRALFCTDAEWAAAGQSVGRFAECSPSAGTEGAVYAAAKCALEWELQRKATTLEQDNALAQRLPSKAVDLSRAEALALQFRIEKKKLLQECLRSITTASPKSPTS